MNLSYVNINILSDIPRNLKIESYQLITINWIQLDFIFTYWKKETKYLNHLIYHSSPFKK